MLEPHYSAGIVKKWPLRSLFAWITNSSQCCQLLWAKVTGTAKCILLHKRGEHGKASEMLAKLLYRILEVKPWLHWGFCSGLQKGCWTVEGFGSSHFPSALPFLSGTCSQVHLWPLQSPAAPCWAFVSSSVDSNSPGQMPPAWGWNFEGFPALLWANSSLCLGFICTRWKEVDRMVSETVQLS
jgi:hypothetical protein